MAAQYQMAEPVPRTAAGERLEEVIAEDRILARVAELAHGIDGRYRGNPLALVVVLKGAFAVAADLIRRIETPLTVDFIGASSYRNSTRSTGEVALADIDRLDLEGRHALVVDDILDTGLTTAAILAAVRERRPASLRLCALLRKPRARALDLPVTAVGFDIADDFVVGYGMDYAERYRNLRAIYRLVFEDERE
jgi:hypoxanthine phosphoribosyltransferase